MKLRRPKKAAILLKSAFALDRRGREAHAIPLYKNAIHLGLSRAARRDAMVCLGSSYRGVGRLAEAKRCLQRVCKLYPRDPLPKLFLALALHDLGEKSAALRLLGTLYLNDSKNRGVAAYRRTLHAKFKALARHAKSR
jgi:tetratricopeptide (TPR) repeat protein